MSWVILILILITCRTYEVRKVVTKFYDARQVIGVNGRDTVFARCVSVRIGPVNN